MSMTEPWTPGPWRISETTPSVVVAGDAELLVQLDDPHGVNPADARLIAAAPEMAEWLAWTVEELKAWRHHTTRQYQEAMGEELMGDMREDEYIATGEALLARIRGEAP